MILADTSIWVDHLRYGDKELMFLLNDDQVVIHPFVIGELACGHLDQRAEKLFLLRNLTQLPVASESEILHFIEHQKLMARGIGYLDAHLLAAVTLTPPVRLWTRDKRLKSAANALQLAYEVTQK